MGLVQGNKYRRCRIKRALLHAMDKVFRPLDPDDNPHRQEPASIKKLLKGDGAWDTRKIILGWIIDTMNGKIEPPPSDSTSQGYPGLRHTYDESHCRQTVAQDLG